ncbi:hypothetical protein ACFVAV_32175 [Nocardia sp. NPDC057663]|uniref:hypothetical protein n=1 Tax=Nocardia sp. NPDC057663 TaxID=3346201 RepID=UPI003671D149
MSTATSALQSYDPAAYPEPITRRRRNPRARRPFSLVRGAGGSPVGRRPAQAARPAIARPEVSRGPAAEVFAAYGMDGLAAARGVLAEAAARPADAALDIAFATVPQTDSPRPRVVRPARADRGRRATGPRGEAVLYARVGGARPARGVHPVRRVEQAKVGFAVLAVAALVTALIVVAFLGLAHMRAGSFGDRFDPAAAGISEQVGAPSAELSGTVR